MPQRTIPLIRTDHKYSLVGSPPFVVLSSWRHQNKYGFTIIAVPSTKRKIIPSSVTMFPPSKESKRPTDSTARTCRPLLMCDGKFSSPQLLESITTLLQRMQETHKEIVAGKGLDIITFDMVERSNTVLLIQPYDMI